MLVAHHIQLYQCINLCTHALYLLPIPNENIERILREYVRVRYAVRVVDACGALDESCYCQYI